MLPCNPDRSENTVKPSDLSNGGEGRNRAARVYIFVPFGKVGFRIPAYQPVSGYIRLKCSGTDFGIAAKPGTGIRLGATPTPCTA